MASVQKHKSRYRVKWHVDGRAVYESYATKKEAENAAAKIEARTLLDGTAPSVADDNRITLAKWWARWEPGRQWRDSSRKMHTVHWTKYIRPVFGKMPLDKITSADVRRFDRKLETRGLSAVYIAGIHATLSMVLQGAVEDELITRNPARGARLRRPPTDPPVALDPDTLTAFFAAVDERTPGLSAFARLIGATGLRRSEAAGLTWDRVDLDAGVIVIDRQMNYAAKRLPAWSPTKTATNRRVLLTDTTVAMLRAHRRTRSVVAITDALVFTRDDGTSWSSTALIRGWRAAAAKLAADGAPLPAGAKGWHTLRHTVASRLLERGVPPVEAAELLGHSPQMLLATYGHVVDRSAADARLRAALDR